MSKMDVICDHSQQNLKVVPLRVLDMCNLQMLYLEGNGLESLPTNIFQKLPKLSWLDLRNNNLREIPVGIAHHACLENLLLEHNCLVKLPNELGLLPKLVVLQLGKNPLEYPAKDIVSKGTQAITYYLRNEYNKEHDLPLEPEPKPAVDKHKKTVSLKKTKHTEKVDVRELLRKASQHNNRLQIENMPTISIRSLSPEPASAVLKNEGVIKSVVYHSPRKSQKITRYCSKLSIPTHYNSNKYVGAKKCRPNELRIMDQELKEIWIGKLRELLIDQERRLQQERNLQALSSWRLMKKLEAPREVRGSERIVAPYDTNPDFERMPSRLDLATDIEKILKRRRCVPKKSADMQKLVNELVSQLWMLESSNEMDQSQSSDLAKSEKEIQKIIGLHKKVIELQGKNENNWSRGHSKKESKKEESQSPDSAALPIRLFHHLFITSSILFFENLRYLPLNCFIIENLA